MKKNIKILVVEDNSDIVDNLQAMLELRGFTVFRAGDGAVGVATARKEMPDLLLLDIMMPKIDGFEVCRILRSDPATRHIKIIMMTALGRMGDVEKAFSCGADDYLIKPFDSDRLIKKLEKILGE